MNCQLKGFSLSLLIHMSALLLIIGMSNSMVNFNKPLVIDFSIEGPSVKSPDKTVPAPADRVTIPRHPQPTEPAKKTTITQEVVPQNVPPETPPSTVSRQVSAVSKTAAETQAPVPFAGPSPKVQQAAGSSPSASNVTHSEVKASGVQGHVNAPEVMKQVYLKEHFAYIRKIVQQKLGYPVIARRRGWEGKVIISFIVCRDGYVRDVTIKEGSGFELLDKNAIVAVQEASPFPRPPVEAQLIIPINYSLN